VFRASCIAFDSIKPLLSLKIDENTCKSFALDILTIKQMISALTIRWSAHVTQLQDSNFPQQKQTVNAIWDDGAFSEVWSVGKRTESIKASMWDSMYGLQMAWSSAGSGFIVRTVWKEYSINKKFDLLKTSQRKDWERTRNQGDLCVWSETLSSHRRRHILQWWFRALKRAAYNHDH